MLLYYIRHGDPIYEPDSLTQLGKQQAEAVSKRLAVYGFDEIYSSTSTRAYETALPTARLLNKDITQLDFFHESLAASYFMVEYEKNKYQWLENIQSYRETFIINDICALGEAWYEYHEFSNMRFKEGMLFYRDKFDAFMLSLGLKHERSKRCYKATRKLPERVAVFAHAGVGGVFLSSILDIPYPEFVTRHEMSHTGVSVIEFNEKHDNIIPKILQYSNDSHLYKEGIPTLYNNTIPI